MKLAVIYDSKTNNTAAVAGYMAEAMNSLEGVEAKTFLYSEVDTEFVKECKGVVFGCPTYAAGPTSDFYRCLFYPLYYKFHNLLPAFSI